jgi:hypothetical protein
MNDETLSQLLARAREAGPHDTSRAEFGFETRIASRLKAVRPGDTFGVWPWRLLPLFATVAVLVSWNSWRSASDRELEIRSGLECANVEWAYVTEITGKTL